MAQAVADSVEVRGKALRLVRNDITEVDVDAFVFYAQPNLALGSGFGTAISVRGGPDIQKELEALGPVKTTDVVVSGAGELRAEKIIHAVGPRFQEDDLPAKLATTLRNCLSANGWTVKFSRAKPENVEMLHRTHEPHFLGPCQQPDKRTAKTSAVHVDSRTDNGKNADKIIGSTGVQAFPADPAITAKSKTSK